MPGTRSDVGEFLTGSVRLSLRHGHASLSRESSSRQRSVSFTFICSTNWQIWGGYTKLTAEVFGISTDSVYVHKAWCVSGAILVNVWTRTLRYGVWGIFM